MGLVEHPLPESGMRSDSGVHTHQNGGPLWAVTEPPLGLAVSHPSTGVTAVRVTGELDTATAPALTDCVRKELAAGTRCLVVDLEAVDFLASAGLTALLESARALADAVPGARLRLSGTAHRAVHRPLHMSGLLSMFTVHTDLAEALSRIESAAGD